MANVGNAINMLAERPAIALTPTEMARQIEAAGKTMQQADHAALSGVQQGLAQAARELDGMVARARTHEKQVDALIWAALFGIVAAMFLILLGNAALERLGWVASAEERAVVLLGGNRWKAGQALMAEEKPKRWRELLAAVRLADANAETLTRCDARARQDGKAAPCTIDVLPPSTWASVEHGRQQ